MKASRTPSRASLINREELAAEALRLKERALEAKVQKSYLPPEMWMQIIPRVWNPKDAVKSTATLLNSRLVSKDWREFTNEKVWMNAQFLQQVNWAEIYATAYQESLAVWQYAFAQANVSQDTRELYLQAAIKHGYAEAVWKVMRLGGGNPENLSANCVTAMQTTVRCAKPMIRTQIEKETNLPEHKTMLWKWTDLAQRSQWTEALTLLNNEKKRAKQMYPQMGNHTKTVVWEWTAQKSPPHKLKIKFEPLGDCTESTVALIQSQSILLKEHTVGKEKRFGLQVYPNQRYGSVVIHTHPKHASFAAKAQVWHEANAWTTTKLVIGNPPIPCNKTQRKKRPREPDQEVVDLTQSPKKKRKRVLSKTIKTP